MARVLVVGAGHNGLVAAILLQLGGHQTLVVEARAKPGGACATETVLDQSFNWGANHLFMLDERVIRATGISLDRLYLVQAEVDAAVILPGTSGSSVSASTAPVYEGELSIAAQILRRHLFDLNSSVAALRDDIAAKRLSSGTLFIDGSVAAVLSHYFKDDRAAIGRRMAGKILSMYSPLEPGSAIALPYLECANAERFGPWASSPGGMGALIDLLVTRLEQLGGRIVCDERVDSFHTKGSVIIGAKSASGATFPSDYVLAAIPPIQLSALFPSTLPRHRPVIEEWTTSRHDGGCSKMLLCSRAPLRFGNVSMSEFCRTLVVFGSDPDELNTAYKDALRDGHSSNPYFEIFASSLFHGWKDPPFLYSIYIMYSSFSLLARLGDGERCDRKRALAHRILAEVSNTEDILSWELRDPIDLQSTFGLPRGNVDHGVFLSSAILDQRDQFHFGAIYSNLVCGSPGCLAGGLVSGVPGYLAAQQMLRMISQNRS